MKSVEKVVAYVTWEDRLLVFDHADFPEAGTQVPAGTIQPGELPEAAVLREAVEETGNSSFLTFEFLGEADFDFSPFGRDELHRRHFFHLPIQGPMPESWRHHETDVKGDEAPIAFEFYWVPVADAAGLLIGEQGRFLEQVLSLPPNKRMQPTTRHARGG